MACYDLGARGARCSAALLTACALMLGCGGQKFSASGEGGANATGGTASGGAGTAGAIGSGGAGAGCVCPAGSYCPAGTEPCRSCADFSTLDFGPREKLLAISGSAVGNQRFPRWGGDDRSLFYRAGSDTSGAGPELWFSDDMRSNAGFVVATGAALSGPLLLDTALPGSTSSNFLYDRAAALGADRDVITDRWDGASIGGALTIAPPPMNAVSASDYSIAYASGTNRAWWMSTRSGAASLMTAPVGSATSVPTTVVLQIPTNSGKTCPRAGSDATPWVTADGALMLFRSFPLDDNCNPIDVDASDSYAAPLNPSDGTPLGSAVALASVNVSRGQLTETIRVLSPDACWLYFASDGGSAESFEFDVYRAPRR